MTPPSTRPRWPRALVALGVFIASWIWIDLAEREPRIVRAAGQEPLLDISDEAEWVAISIAHVRQLLGEPPPGIELARQRGIEADDPWRRGVQGATFGAANPCVAKLIWGGIAVAEGHPNMPPTVFQKFARDFNQAQAAWRKTEPARPSMRLVVVGFVALCALLVFHVARSVAGWPAGLVAWAAWCSSPMIQTWSHYLRPDFLAAAFVLASAAALVSWRGALTGSTGPGRQVAASVGLGLLAGLAVATKLNGALAGIAIALALPIASLALRRDLPARGRPLFAVGSLALAGLVAFALLFATTPVLWHDPLGEGREILAFWDRHMAMQQERWEALGGAVGRTAGERIEMVLGRLWRREEPLAALAGVPGGLLLVPVGLGLVLARAFGPWRAEAVLERWSALVVTIWTLAVFALTTLWVPLDWDRYYFVLIAIVALGQGIVVGRVVDALLRRRATTAGSA